jgi:hypothetical protein
MKHKFTVHVLMLLWLCAIARVAYAASFFEEARAWDYDSLLTAALGGLCGGAFKTIYSLATDTRAVFQILKESRKDLVTATLAGGFVYIVMIMVESKWPGTITQEIRFGGVLIAGWVGAAVFTIAGRLAKAKVEAAEQQLRAGAPGAPPPAPTSAAVPLGEK